MFLLNAHTTLNIQQAGWFGGYEVILIVVVVLLLFGGRKIPELMRGIGKGIKEFKSGISEEENSANTKSTAESTGTDKN
jgi:sec-independent protein translocase protein TatA